MSAEPAKFLLAVGRSPAAVPVARIFSGDRQPNMFARLSKSELERVMSRGKAKRFPAGKTLFAQGEKHNGVFLIESGLVRTFYTAPSGREITLAYWPPGNLVGTPQVLGAGTFIWSGIAARKTDAVAFSGSCLRKLLEEHPTLAVGMIEALEFKGKYLSALLQMLGTRSVSERLGMLLVNLADLHGTETESGIAIEQPFTHEVLAQMVGASRQWVTMTLDRFQADGLIRIGRCRIELLDVNALNNYRAAPQRRSGIARSVRRRSSTIATQLL